MLSVYICNDISNTLIKILHTCYQQSKNTLVLCNDASVSVIDNLLWTYSQTAFLPHCTFRDSFQEDNMIVIGNDHKLKRDDQSVLIFLPNYKIDDMDGDTLNNEYALSNKCEKLIFLLEKNPKNNEDIQKFASEAIQFMSSNSLYLSLFNEQKSNGEAFLIVNSENGWKKYAFDKLKNTVTETV